VTDPALAVFPPPARPTPGTAVAASVVTIVLAAITGLMALAVTVVTVIVGPTLMSDFDEPTWLVALVLGLIVVGLAWAVVSTVAAVKLLRRRRWAWWTLLVLSGLRAVLGLGSGLGGALTGLLSVGAGVAVVVLLLLPSTREWLAGEE
jgi:hypothetical protein